MTQGPGHGIRCTTSSGTVFLFAVRVVSRPNAGYGSECAVDSGRPLGRAGRTVPT